MNLTFTPSAWDDYQMSPVYALVIGIGSSESLGAQSASKTAPTSTEKPGSKFEAANCPRR